VPGVSGLVIQTCLTRRCGIEQEAENFSLLGLCAKETMRLMDEESDDDKIKVYKDAFSVLYGLLGRGGER